MTWNPWSLRREVRALREVNEVLMRAQIAQMLESQQPCMCPDCQRERVQQAKREARQDARGRFYQ